MRRVQSFIGNTFDEILRKKALEIGDSYKTAVEKAFMLYATTPDEVTKTRYSKFERIEAKRSVMARRQ
jgi:hypothetical protein